MRFATVQFDIAWEDKPRNHARVEALLEEAAVPEGAYIVLPELGDTGFSFDLDRIVDDRSLEWARDLARRRRAWVQPGYAGRAPDGSGRNRAAIVDPEGTVCGVYEKVHPFTFGREGEHYSGGDRILVRRAGDLRVCPLICYDLRFPELWRLGAMAGAEVFTIGASWPDARQSHWRALSIARAIENQAYVVAVNRVGSDPHLSYAGGSLIVSPHGTILAEGGAGTAVLQADLAAEDLRSWRATFPALRDSRQELLGSIHVDIGMPGS